MSGDLDIDLSQLVVVQQVQVVQSIDVEALQRTLKWLVDKANASGAPGNGGQLADENRQLKEQLDALRKQQDEMQQQMDTKVEKDQLPGLELQSVPTDVADLQQRLAALEEATQQQQQQQQQGQQGHGQQHEHAQETAAPAAAAPAGTGELSSRIDALERALEKLGHQPKQPSFRTQPVPELQGNGSADVVEELRALRQALRALEGRVDNKADQSTVQDIRASVRDQLRALQVARQGSQVQAPGTPARQDDSQQPATDADADVATANGGGSVGGVSHGSGDLSIEVAALAARIHELDADRALGLEALEASVAALKAALASKADAGRVGDLQVKVADLGLALANKVDKSALDELRLRQALAARSALVPTPAAAAAAAAANGGAAVDDADGAAVAEESGAEGATASADDALLAVIQSMVEDKAGKAELAALGEVLAGKAGRDELETVRARVAVDGDSAGAGAGGFGDGQEAHASKEDLSRLADQVGDLYAEVDKLRQELAALPVTSTLGGPLSRQQSMQQQAAGAASAAALPQGAGAAAAHALSAAGPERQALATLSPAGTSESAFLAQLFPDMQVLKDQVEMVAHAVNILAVGLEPRSSNANGAGSAPGTPFVGAAISPNGGRESRSASGAYERLLKLLGSQGLNHKMDHFDPEVLNKMSQKMAYVDALLKSPSAARPAGVEDIGMREFESQLRKMARDIRVVKDRMAALPAQLPLGEGEHALLAGKPAVLGYRCMACDRPLEKLDTTPGPHVPTHLMLAKGSTAAADRAASSRLPPADALSPNQRKKAPYDPAKRGPQTWYEDNRPIAADGLPPSDVGPKLPGGGWTAGSGRVSQSGTGRTASDTPSPPTGQPSSAGRPMSPGLAEAITKHSHSGPIYDLPILPHVNSKGQN